MKLRAIQSCLVVALLAWAIPGLDARAAGGGDQSSRQAALALHKLNGYRQKMGLHALRLDPALGIGCKAHAQYLVYNKGLGLSAHHEDPGTRGYSSMGAEAGPNSGISYGGPGAAAIESLIGTFYHRLPLLSPNGRRLGYGHSTAATLLRVESNDGDGDGVFPQQPLGEFLTPAAAMVTASADSVEWTAFPYDGQQDVPLGFSGEIPNPIPHEDPDDFTGYPITLSYNSAADLRLQVATLTDDDGGDVPVWIAGLGPMGTTQDLCLLAKDALKPGTTYTVHVEMLLNGRSVEHTWHFSTRADG